MEENFGSKKLWQIALTVELAKRNFGKIMELAADLTGGKVGKNWTEFAEKTLVF